MEKQNFENLNAWKKAKELCLYCYLLTKSFPPEERYSLSDQTRRASISVPSNIAEGYSRKSVKDLCHFLSIAIGSTYEIMTQIDMAMELGYITLSQKEKVFILSQEVLKLINGYIKFKQREKQ
jgi:four helix bundle protein